MKLWLLFLLPLLAGALHAADRIALVIGNNAYTSFPEARQLTSPRADAADVAEKLRAIGFTVLAPVLDGTREAIVKAKNNFLAQAEGAQIALFYFSGHGFQVGDENFLIPSDMPRITSYTVLKDNALMLRDSLMVGLEEAGAQTKVIILDCCRDNPFAAQLEKALNGSNKSLRTKGGTGEITGYGPGFYLAFATSPGTTADDGNGLRNSPFTSALLTHLQNKAGENIRDLFDEVKETVRETSGEEQVPWTNDSLSKSHLKVLALLVPGASKAPSVSPKPPETPASGGSAIPAAHPKLKPLAELMLDYQKFVAAGKDGASPPAPAPKGGTGGLLDTGIPGKVVQIKLPGEVLMKFCYCPPGSFLMGSPAGEKGRGTDEDQVQVRISKGFWMAQTEVTQGQWQALMGSNPSQFQAAEQPVENVSWKDAEVFMAKLSQKVFLLGGWTYALPTEAQWEHACRAGTESAYSFGSDDSELFRHGNYAGNIYAKLSLDYKGLPGVGDRTVAVARHPANAWGIHDMHGNVQEWCADWKADTLPGGTDPAGAASGTRRVTRGGAWSSDAPACRAASRSSSAPAERSNILGFRPALVLSR